TVLHVIPKSPAEAAGLKSGDVLLEVNGKAVNGMSLERIVDSVRGPAGTSVSLRVLREGQSQPITLNITRARVDVPNVTWAMVPGQPVAHIALRSFGFQTDAQLKQIVQEARSRGAKGILLDLRGNPGGLKEQAVAVTSEFLTDGNVFLEQDADGQRTPVPVRP